MMLLRILGTEFAKLRHSKVTWISLLAYLAMGAFAGFFIWIIKNPGMAQSLGLIGQKATIAVGAYSGDWAGLLGMMQIMAATGGMILFSIVMIYVFGREYADGTAKNMLGLGIPRVWFLVAKLVVASVWFGLLFLALLGEGLVIGTLLGLPGWSSELFIRTMAATGKLALLSLALQPLVIWIAVASANYLAPLGYVLFTLLIGNFLSKTDWAGLCPWSVLPLLMGMSGPQASDLAPASWLVMAATFVIGLTLAIIHQNRADNCQ